MRVGRQVTQISHSALSGQLCTGGGRRSEIAAYGSFVTYFLFVDVTANLWVGGADQTLYTIKPMLSRSTSNLSTE